MILDKYKTFYVYFTPYILLSPYFFTNKAAFPLCFYYLMCYDRKRR